MTPLLIKAFHIIFMVTWFAGLFYLPRLFVYHAMIEDPSADRAGIERFKVMERKLLWGITTPGGILTVLFGGWLLVWQPALLQTGWMQLKLLLVAALAGYHLWCVFLWRDFRNDRNRHSHRWYRFFNELPVLALVAIVLLVELRPG